MADDTLRLIPAHRFELYGFIRAVVRHDADAEDLFQEVAAVIVKQAAADASAEVRDFRAWSREIARRTVLQGRHQGVVRVARSCLGSIEILQSVY